MRNLVPALLTNLCGLARGRGALLVAAVMFLVAACPAYADTVIPPGLNPGDQYRLVFVTSGFHNATSTNISDYDSFVTSQADSNAALSALGTTWQVIGSTSAVDAFDHIGGSFSIPVYNLGGQLVATDATDLWDGTIDAPIQYDENGNAIALNAVVWTGTQSNGTADRGLGNTSPNQTSDYGDPRDTVDAGAWIDAGVAGNSASTSFYGISGTLTVPAEAVPEPGSLWLLGLGLGLLPLCCRKAGAPVPQK